MSKWTGSGGGLDTKGSNSNARASLAVFVGASLGDSSTEFKQISGKSFHHSSKFHFGPGARFSKVPKLYGPFSGVTISFVSQERREFNTSNFTVIFLFVTLKTC